MLKKMLAIVALTGLSACLDTGSDGVVCQELEAPLQSLSDALVAHPETPAPVGIAGAQVVIVGQGGC